MSKAQQLYRVRVKPNPQCKADHIKDGFLFDPELNEIMEYTRGIAIKKANAFGGKIEKAPAKVVKQESFKLYVVIEKLTEFTDGTEKYEDVDLNEAGVAYPLTRTGEITSLDEAFKKAEELSNEHTL